MNKKSLVIGLALSLVLIFGSILGAAAAKPSGEPSATLLVSGLETATGAGSTIGPGGALYVTEGEAGTILRVDPRTGEVTTFFSGLPQAIIPIGGVMDVAFVDGTAYALVTLVGSDLGGSDKVGIYRLDSPTSYTVIADIGEFNLNNPPSTAFDVPSGVQYAMQAYRDGFLVTDGHLNRMLRVTLDGVISVQMAFDNIVPTGLDVRGNTIFMAEAGPVPHAPETGRVVAFGPKSTSATEVASGASLLVDVEFGRGSTLYALSQGEFSGGPAGAPALPDTGSLVKVNGDGSFSVILDDLDRPTSVEFIKNSAYVVTLGGEIWRIDDVSGPPYRVSH